jgi:hypothetical protein
MDNEKMLPAHNGILFSHKKNEIQSLVTRVELEVIILSEQKDKLPCDLTPI